MKKNLLIDIGNSNVKIAAGIPNSHEVKLIKQFQYEKKIFQKEFEKNFPFNDPSLKQINLTGISIVNPLQETSLRSFFKKNYKHSITFINRSLKFPVRINYEATLGNDRICNAVGAVITHKNKNILVIDFGTATTYTLINNSTITGGLISPGLGTGMNSLINNSSLPEVDIKFPEKLFNSDTIQNIQSGVLYQALFSMEKIISETKRRFKGLLVIATGGYSELIYNKTNLINTVDRMLLFKGLNFILDENNN